MMLTIEFEKLKHRSGHGDLVNFKFIRWRLQLQLQPLRIEFIGGEGGKLVWAPASCLPLSEGNSKSFCSLLDSEFLIVFVLAYN